MQWLHSLKKPTAVAYIPIPIPVPGIAMSVIAAQDLRGHIRSRPDKCVLLCNGVPDTLIFWVSEANQWGMHGSVLHRAA
jgi:hypothetical protein